MTTRPPSLEDTENEDDRRVGADGSGDGSRRSAVVEPPVHPLERSSNVLLSAPTLSAAETTTCAELMDVGDPSETNVLAVTYRRDPVSWLSDYRAHFGDEPENLKIISGRRMSPESAVLAGGADGTDERQMGRVESPRDLTGLGIQITKFLRHIEAGDRNGGASETAICFDSLTTLLQSVDQQQVYRFLHFVTSRLSAVGGTAHYHIHPDAIDDRTVNTMRTLCDGLVAVDEERVEEVVVR